MDDPEFPTGPVFCLFCASLQKLCPFQHAQVSELQETVGALVLERHTVFACNSWRCWQRLLSEKVKGWIRVKILDIKSRQQGVSNRWSVKTLWFYGWLIDHVPWSGSLKKSVTFRDCGFEKMIGLQATAAEHTGVRYGKKPFEGKPPGHHFL